MTFIPVQPAETLNLTKTIPIRVVFKVIDGAISSTASNLLGNLSTLERAISLIF